MSNADSSEPVIGTDALLAQVAWVRRLAARLCSGADDAEDVAQQTLLIAWPRAPREPTHLRGWLAAIARSVVRRRVRSDTRRAARERKGSLDEALPSSVDLVARAELQRAVVDAVLELTEPYRSTVLLRFFEERSAEEIAHRRGEPIETVRTRLKRGMAQLRERLGRTLDVETAGGARRLGLEALVWWVTPAGEGVVAAASAAGVGAAGAASAVGVVGIAMKTKLALVVAVVAASSWMGWQRWGPDEPTERGDEVAAAAAPVPAPSPTDEPTVAERQLLPAEERDEAEPVPPSDAPATVPLSPRMAKLRETLTFVNLFEGGNVVEDLGPEMKALLRGLTTDSLDLLALLDYLEACEASAWVVRGSLESTLQGFDGRATGWRQAYENSSGAASVLFADVEHAPDGRGRITLMAPLGQLRDEFTAQLGDVSAINPLLVVNVFAGKNGVNAGMLQLNLQEGRFADAPVPEGVSEERLVPMKRIREASARARDRIEELRSVGGLPSLVRWQVTEGRGELTYYRYGSRSKEEFASGQRGGRPLSVEEIASIGRLYERLQAAAECHVVDAGLTAAQENPREK
ncbi:MAG: RNA polymerase sigma factor [Planctomycetes bacterium]|nr:RNA polymerase sigma factor [Planctomycetota bacterium]